MNTSASGNIIDKYNWFLQKSGIERKDYQFDGIQWCVHRETAQPLPITVSESNGETSDVVIADDNGRPIRGGFIADEMGLGKTIMMIATFVIHFVPRTLIILPNILVEQWHSEILRTTGHKALIFHGPNKKKISLQQLLSATIVISTYNTIAVTKPNKKNIYKPVKPNSLLHQVQWDRIVFDEAHHLRNKNSRWIGSKLLRTNIRWLISGTLIQNKRTDFFNLCNALGIPARFYTNSEKIRLLIDMFVLKRTKKQVGISLPEVSIDNSTVCWNNETEQALSTHIHHALIHTNNKLKFITRSRQFCILPSLIQPTFHRLLEDKTVPSLQTSDDPLSGTTKINAVVQTIVSRIHNGHGKLVFCHYRGEIDLLQRLLKQHGVHNVGTFDGRINQKERFRRLRSQLDVIILQIQTGCEGLNLQKNFSEIYFVSPHWNPSIEDQAVARCHRIGQNKPVTVFRFYMDALHKTSPVDANPSEKNTIYNALQNGLNMEQYIHSVQHSKRNISSLIMP